MTAPIAVLPLYDVDPEVLAGLVLACPAVAALSGGAVGSAATYLPGRKVVGIRLTAGSVEVHPVMRYGATVSELAQQIRYALAGWAGSRTVDIVVEDVLAPGEQAAVATPAPTLPAGGGRLGWPTDPIPSG